VNAQYLCLVRETFGTNVSVPPSKDCKFVPDGITSQKDNLFNFILFCVPVTHYTGLYRPAELPKSDINSPPLSSCTGYTSNNFLLISYLLKGSAIAQSL